MTVLGVHHAGRTVRDMDASLRFYRDLMGFRVDDDEGESAVLGDPIKLALPQLVVGFTQDEKHRRAAAVVGRFHSGHVDLAVDHDRFLSES